MNDQTDKRTIRTEDGVEVGEGDQVYGFHSQLCVGTIRVGSMGSEERQDEYHDRLMQGSVQPWFTVDFENGKSELLNGQRVSSVEGARRLGYLPQHDPVYDTPESAENKRQGGWGYN